MISAKLGWHTCINIDVYIFIKVLYFDIIAIFDIIVVFLYVNSVVCDFL